MNVHSKTTASLFTFFALLISLLGNIVNVTPAYALSNAPLANMPTINGFVQAIAPDGAGGAYIGGIFTQLTPAGGGPAVTRNNIAHVNADGSIDATWNPNANSGVNAIAVSGSTVYVSGFFSNIGGQNRNRIAALNATTGNATTFDPNANNSVYALAVSADGSTVYAGGRFTNIGGAVQNYIASLNATTGSATAWNPNVNYYVYALAVSGTTVYAGGDFTTVNGGTPRNYIAALDATTGNATAWNPNPNAHVNTIVVNGSAVYASGNFTTIGGQNRNYIAALDATTGNSIAWNPNADNVVSTLAVSGSAVYTGGIFTNTGGAARNYIAALDATTGNSTAWNPNADNVVGALAVSGNLLYVGGYFTTIGGVSRPYFVAFDITPPTVISHTLQASYTGTGPSTFTVTFSVNVSNAGGGAGTDDVTNVNNFKIINKGANGVLDTATCASPINGDDALILPTDITYINPTAVINLGSALPVGSYSLFVCGTTSIVGLTSDALAGDGINSGTDFIFDFAVGAVTAEKTEKTSASSLPKTGFAPNKITSLPAQPAALAYAKLGDLWLEIPSLNVKSNIVGVPQNKDNSWDVTWLGNDTGWLNGTAFPTWNGNSVLTAHVTNASGVDGPFVALKSLQYGDQIIVHFGGVKYIYEVRSTKMARPYSTSYAFQSLQDYSYLTLITCQGYNPLNESYLFRRVVRAVLVDVK